MTIKAGRDCLLLFILSKHRIKSKYGRKIERRKMGLVSFSARSFCPQELGEICLHVLKIAHVKDRLFVARDTDLVESNPAYDNPLFFDTPLQSHTES